MASKDTPQGQGGPREWLSPKEVAALLGVHVSTLRRWIAQGQFPDGVRYSPKTVRWRRSTVEAFQGVPEAAAVPA